MEYGLISKTISSDFNTTKNIQELNHIEPTIETGNKEEDLNTKLNELKDIKEPKNNIIKYNEVTLSNTNFGFNDNSKDFFVRVTRGPIENKYPTEDMMKMKAYLMELNDDAS